MSRTLIHNVRRPGHEACHTYMMVEGQVIVEIGEVNGNALPDADTVIDGNGALLLPGVIDCHVHFREPGMTEKADIYTESRAAIAGGVTSYLEMPNTNPATTTIERWGQKMQLAEEKSWANYAFFIGATNDNIEELKQADYTRVPGVKLFMGSSTGNMLVDEDDAISRIFREVDAVVAVHAEDQDTIKTNTEMFKGIAVDGDLPIELHSQIRSASACYKSTAKAVELAKRFNHRLHVCHLSTGVELRLFEPGDPAHKLITSEVSPHHLMWSVDDYKYQGAKIKMNPAVKDDADKQALTEAVCDGLIDIVATDHAPHLLSQKQGGALKAVSGAPLVQFSLPWMLTHYDESTVERVMCVNPANVYSIDRRGALEPGNYADFVLVDKVEPYLVEDEEVISKCGWSPMSNAKMLEWRVAQTWVNGQCVYADRTFAERPSAMPLRFNLDSQA